MKTINLQQQERLSHKFLLSVLDYDMNSGDFTWKVKMSTRAMPGNIAGSLSPRGYVLIKIQGCRYLAHRLAWFYVYEIWPTMTIDHIDRNPSNNRISNLRDVNNSTNMRNRNLFTKNESGQSGVICDHRNNSWVAQITIHGRQIRLGSFLNKKEAIHARKEAEKKYYT
jgi:hypothetical protein